MINYLEINDCFLDNILAFYFAIYISCNAKSLSSHLAIYLEFDQVNCILSLIEYIVSST